MADQPKKKPASAKTRNDSRKNGKAFKTAPDAYRRPGKSYRGSHTKGNRLTELDKALLGGGAMRRIMRRIPEAKERAL